MRIVSSRWQILSSTSLYLAMSFAIVVNSSQILLTSFVLGANLVERNADSATTGAMAEEVKVCHERCVDGMCVIKCSRIDEIGQRLSYSPVEVSLLP
ncbi:hypothetical protein VTO58DRAFT_108739 [Aureobasidium pullulans]